MAETKSKTKLKEVDLTVHQVPIGDLKLCEYNPRALTEDEYRQIHESIERHGMLQPLIVNKSAARKNIVIGGNQRLMVMREMGYETVPIVYVDYSNLDIEKELSLRLNKNQGHFDFDALANFHEEMLINVGFTPTELDDIFEVEPDSPKKDNAPNPPAEAKSKQGDIYLLGDHRLMCGDSANRDQVAILMDGHKAEIVFTDPPYNVNYSGTGEKTSETIEGDNLSPEDFQHFIDLVFQAMRLSMKDGAVYYVCSGWSSYPVFHVELLKNDFHRAGVIIWVKNNASMGWNDFRYKHEWVLHGKKEARKTKAVSMMYGWKKGTHYFRDSRQEYDVWEVPRKESAEYLHPTEKPVWLIEKALANSSHRGEIMLDLFGGSGSSVIACERMKRKCFVMEHDPKYVDVIVQRWETYTGQQATLIQGA